MSIEFTRETIWTLLDIINIHDMYTHTSNIEQQIIDRVLN